MGFKGVKHGQDIRIKLDMLEPVFQIKCVKLCCETIIAAALLETEKHFKTIMGYRDLWQLKAHLHELDVEHNLVKERKAG